MPGATPPPLPRRPRTTGFQPRFTVGLLYLFVFFMFFALVLILPELLEVLETVPPGPEQERIARQVAERAAQGRILPAAALAVLSVGVGGYYRVLPGMRE